MKRLFTCLSLFLFAVTMSIGNAVASDYGTPAEAKAMLERAVAALQTDEATALDQFSKGENGFKDRDLYPYCGGMDGNFTAHPSLVGKSLKALKDKDGNAFGEQIYSTATAGEISEVPYMWPRPGETEPVQKVAYVTKVDDQICAVGYYQ